MTGASFRGPQRRCVRRESRRDGRRQGYRDVLHVRASFGTFHRQSFNWLHPQRQSVGPVETGAHRRDLQPPVAAP